jgi:hypothetical protein
MHGGHGGHRGGHGRHSGQGSDRVTTPPGGA